MMSTVFWIVGVLTIIAATLAVLRESPIYAAIWTLVALGGIAVEFLLLHAGFLAAMQILLYAGAIMVLFVFVIMLLSLKKEEHGDEPPLANKAFAFVVAAIVFFALASAARSYKPREANIGITDPQLARFVPTGGATTDTRVDFGSTEHFGRFLYGGSVVPFELVSVLLTAALAGVIILARRKVILGVEDVTPPSPPGTGTAPAAHPPHPQALEAVELKH